MNANDQHPRTCHSVTTEADGLAERFKFRHVNEITGTFVLVIVAVLIAAVVWTGHSQRWFRSRVTLRIILPEARRGGNPARIGGLLFGHARGNGLFDVDCG